MDAWDFDQKKKKILIGESTEKVFILETMCYLKKKVSSRIISFRTLKVMSSLHNIHD